MELKFYTKNLLAVILLALGSMGENTLFLLLYFWVDNKALIFFFFQSKNLAKVKQIFFVTEILSENPLVVILLALSSMDENTPFCFFTFG